MSDLVADCPRCGAKQITFDLVHTHQFGTAYQWQKWLETFCICRNCKKSTVFVLSQNDITHTDLLSRTRLKNLTNSVNNYMKVEDYVSSKDKAAAPPPDYLPKAIDDAFREGATCMAVKCYNAAGTMFRLCIDLATIAHLPAGEVAGLTPLIRGNLARRLKWLFENGKLHEGLRELAKCIREDGNDGAHAGTLAPEDAADIQDFTTALLERVYTEPQKLVIANKRREERRKTEG